MDYTITVGFVAAVLTAVSFFPQVIKVWKTKSTRDISLGMFLISCSGFFLWFIYGVLTQDPPIVIANILTFLQAFVILIFKVKFN
jgi:MtN3 and saliva related transmembrane protein